MFLPFLAIASAPWSRGSYGVLTFPSCASYSWRYGPTTFPSAAPTNASGCGATSGHGILGAYDGFRLSYGAAGELEVMYFHRADAFVFRRAPLTPDLPTAWPAFSVDAFPVGPEALKVRCIGWGEHYFFPGNVLPRTAHTHPAPFSLRQCSSGGPLFAFGVAEEAGNAFALSPLDNFTTTGVDGFGMAPRGGGSCGGRQCALVPSHAVLMARPGLVRTTRAFGAVLRQWHGTKRLRGPGVTQLSYWNDNQAGYSWWTVGPDQEVWGKPEDIYLRLKEGYDRAGVPIRGWEPDNNWLVTYKDGNEWGNGSGVAKNWIGRCVPPPPRAQAAHSTLTKAPGSGTTTLSCTLRGAQILWPSSATCP